MLGTINMKSSKWNEVWKASTANVWNGAETDCSHGATRCMGGPPLGTTRVEMACVPSRSPAPALDHKVTDVAQIFGSDAWVDIRKRWAVGLQMLNLVTNDQLRLLSQPLGFPLCRENGVYQLWCRLVLLFTVLHTWLISPALRAW